MAGVELDQAFSEACRDDVKRDDSQKDHKKNRSDSVVLEHIEPALELLTDPSRAHQADNCSHPYVSVEYVERQADIARQHLGQHRDSQNCERSRSGGLHGVLRAHIRCLDVLGVELSKEPNTVES